MNVRGLSVETLLLLRASLLLAPGGFDEILGDRWNNRVQSDTLATEYPSVQPSPPGGVNESISIALVVTAKSVGAVNVSSTPITGRSFGLFHQTGNRASLNLCGFVSVLTLCEQINNRVFAGGPVRVSFRRAW